MAVSGLIALVTDLLSSGAFTLWPLSNADHQPTTGSIQTVTKHCGGCWLWLVCPPLEIGAKWDNLWAVMIANCVPLLLNYLTTNDCRRISLWSVFLQTLCTLCQWPILLLPSERRSSIISKTVQWSDSWQSTHPGEMGRWLIAQKNVSTPWLTLPSVPESAATCD